MKLRKQLKTIQIKLLLVFISCLLPVVLSIEAVVAQANVLNQGIQSQQLVSQNLQTMWNDVLNSGVWDATVWVGTLFTVVLIGVWVARVLRDCINNELSVDYLSSFIWLFLVLLLLINDGAVLRNVVLGMRELVNLTNQEVLSVQIGGQTLEQSFNNTVQSVNFNSWIQQQKAQCNSLPDPQAVATCNQNLNQQIQQNQNAIQSQNPSFNPAQWAADAIGDAFQRGLEIMLFGIGIAFQWLIEITLLLTGLLAPLAIAISLLPLQQKTIFTWLLGFYTVGMCKLFYNVIVGLVAHILSNTTASGNPSGGTIIIAIAVGILSPILAVGLAAGAGMATFMSLSSLMSQVGGVSARFGGASGGRMLGMAGKATGTAMQVGATNIANKFNSRSRYSSNSAGSGSSKSPQRPAPPQLPATRGSVSIVPPNPPTPQTKRLN